MEYKNPILTGMYPDPSICRADQDYYLVTSSFEYLPGIPVFHSRDLVHWEQIGHAIHRNEQLDMQNIAALGGIYAPTIRYHDGMFYVISTLVTGRGAPSYNFYVYASNPRGPWSMPIFVGQSGIDPSLFFDSDGSVYLASNLYGKPWPNPVIQQSILDIRTGALLTQPRVIANGSGGACTEGPHLFYRNGYYYLLCAEGGTALGHMVTLFRADTPWGSFTQGCPHNPILTARDDIAAPLCAAGHADFVTTQHGETWMVFLCYRHAFSKYHHLGRETALLPVTWDADGWPHVVGGKPPAEFVKYPATQIIKSQSAQTTDIDTSTPGNLALCWNSVRHFPNDTHLEQNQGDFILQGTAGTLCDANCDFIAQRQRHFDCEIQVSITFHAHCETEEAGLAIRQSDEAHYAWVCTQRNGKPSIVLKRTVCDIQTESRSYPVPYKATLFIKADRYAYSFGIRKNNQILWLESASTHLLSSEVNWGFTGVYIGMYAAGNSRNCQNYAVFKQFSYSGTNP